MKIKLFTSESVLQGHPDKLCDQVADGILDEILRLDPLSRVACDVSASTGMVLIYGQITTAASIDVSRIARQVIQEIGYTDEDFGIDGKKCSVLTGIYRQSPDVAAGVNVSFETKNGSMDELDRTGAGDQGVMFGFACSETPELMPAGFVYARNLAMKIDALRKSGTITYLRPDGKTQVTLEYHDDIPVRVEAVVIACQHDEDADYEKIRTDMINKVIMEVIPQKMIDENTKIFINSTGRFVTGGPEGDSGWVGKKTSVDTYGSYARHGGGSFSGKDPTKVDRSAAYAARYVAKNIVAAGLAKKCEIQLGYAIGVANPVSVMIETYGTSTVPEESISNLVMEHFDLRPAAIIRQFELRRPIYRQLACYGHFGRPELDLPWEKTDKAGLLKSAGLEMR